MSKKLEQLIWGNPQGGRTLDLKRLMSESPSVERQNPRSAASYASALVGSELLGSASEIFSTIDEFIVLSASLEESYKKSRRTSVNLSHNRITNYTASKQLRNMTDSYAVEAIIESVLATAFIYATEGGDIGAQNNEHAESILNLISAVREFSSKLKLNLSDKSGFYSQVLKLSADFSNDSLGPALLKYLREYFDLRFEDLSRFDKAVDQKANSRLVARIFTNTSARVYLADNSPEISKLGFQINHFQIPYAARLNETQNLNANDIRHKNFKYEFFGLLAITYDNIFENPFTEKLGKISISVKTHNTFSTIKDLKFESLSPERLKCYIEYIIKHEAPTLALLQAKRVLELGDDVANNKIADLLARQDRGIVATDFISMKKVISTLYWSSYGGDSFRTDVPAKLSHYGFISKPGAYQSNLMNNLMIAVSEAVEPLFKLFKKQCSNLRKNISKYQLQIKRFGLSEVVDAALEEIISARSLNDLPKYGSSRVMRDLDLNILLSDEKPYYDIDESPVPKEVSNYLEVMDFYIEQLMSQFNHLLAVRANTMNQVEAREFDKINWLSAPFTEVLYKLNQVEKLTNARLRAENKDKRLKENAHLILKLPTGKVWKQYPDGHKWVFINTNMDSIEAKLMGDCGAVPHPDGKLLSLRDGDGFPVIHIGLVQLFKEYDVYASIEIRGYSNSKPELEYEPYILDILDDPRIAGISYGVYFPSSQFKLNTANEKHMNLIMNKGWHGFYEPRVNNPDNYIKFIRLAILEGRFNIGQSIENFRIKTEAKNPYRARNPQKRMQIGEAILAKQIRAAVSKACKEVIKRGFNKPEFRVDAYKEPDLLFEGILPDGIDRYGYYWTGNRAPYDDPSLNSQVYPGTTVTLQFTYSDPKASAFERDTITAGDITLNTVDMSVEIRYDRHE